MAGHMKEGVSQALEVFDVCVHMWVSRNGGTPKIDGF